MKKIWITLFVFITASLMSGCALFGKSGVEIAAYSVIEQQNEFEIRHYDQLMLVSTAMPQGMESQREPFYKLFDYISGNNQADQDMAMTAPVFIEQTDAASETMSFVLPANFSIENAPLPADSDVYLENIKDYTVASITFNGRFTQDNINQHINQLQNWINSNGYKAIGGAKAAGYNPPFTIPAFRRNEILIPVVNNKHLESLFNQYIDTMIETRMQTTQQFIAVDMCHL